MTALSNQLGPAVEPGAARVPRRLRGEARRGLIPATILGLLILVAILGPALAPYPPNLQQFSAGRLLTPGAPGHLLGTDLLARDELSRLLAGTRESLLIAVSAVALGGIVGFTLGVLAGYVRGPFETIVVRLLDGLLAFPTVILALTLAVAMGPGVRSAVIAIAVVSVPSFARLARAQTLRAAGSTYVAAGRAMGAGPVRLIGVHIVPNIRTACIAQAALALGYAIPAEATLSFLGLGVQLPTPSWGNMISESYTTLASDPWPMILPVLAIMVTTLSASLLADAFGAKRLVLEA